MSGASRADWLRYRELWFSLLSRRGSLRAGAANSDTHSLSLERVGYPRNLVFGGTPVRLEAANLDVEGFDADVRAGRMIGTDGPVMDVTIDDGAGNIRRPGLDAFTVTPTAGAGRHVDRPPLDPGEGAAGVREWQQAQAGQETSRRSSSGVGSPRQPAGGNSAAVNRIPLVDAARRGVPRRRRLARGRGGDASGDPGERHGMTTACPI